MRFCIVSREDVSLFALLDLGAAKPTARTAVGRTAACALPRPLPLPLPLPLSSPTASAPAPAPCPAPLYVVVRLNPALTAHPARANNIDLQLIRWVTGFVVCVMFNFFVLCCVVCATDCLE